MSALTVRPAALACLIAAFFASPDTTSQASHQAEAWACDQTPIVITRASLWTPEGIQTKRELVVEKGSIRRIGNRVDRPGSAREIDAEGAIVLPGLIDSHAHLDVWPGPMPRDAMPIEQVLSTLGRQTLSSGVTTVRMHLSGLDDGPPFKRQAADDCSPAPRVVLGGPGLEGGAPDLAVRLMRGVSSPEDARRKVRDVASSGADWLAIHDADRFSKLELEAIAAEAQVRAIKLMAAGDRFDEIRAALSVTGVITLEYLNRTTAPAYPEDVIRLLQRHLRSIYLVTPIGYYTRFHGYRLNPAAVTNPIHTRFIDPAFAEGLLAALQRQLREGDGGAIEASFQTLGPKFRQLRAAGLTLLLGTDSGSPGQFHSDAIWHEMRAWRDLGVPVDRIIEAGTVLPSRMLGRSDIGQIREGGRADLVIYSSDPRKTLDVGDVRDVIKGGVVFVRNGRWVGP
jgi:imidazolonepropionase-like amidohydrolase